MARRFFLVFILLLSYFLFMPHTLSDVNATHCTAQRPGSAPILTSATPQDKSVTLTWIEAQDPVTYYLVAYGRSANIIEYGAPNIGGRGTISFTVGELTNGVKYYFRVRAVNNCKPGKFSNKLPAIPGYKSVKSVSQPNLSIYKTVEGASASATPTEELNEEKAPPPDLKAIAIDELANCSNCQGIQLLTIEVAALIVYLYLTGKFSFFKRIYAATIPFAIYIVFSKINGSCTNNGFFCKYFLQLDIVLFMTAIILYKNKYINIKLNLFKRLFKKIKRKL